MAIKQKIGLIGVGNMGSAILDGVLVKQLASKEQIWIFDAVAEKMDDFAQRSGVFKAETSAKLIAACDVVLLAIKPQDLEKIAGEVSGEGLQSKVLISILAGTPIEKIQQALGAKAKVVRAMPNLGAKVGEAITAITGANKEAVEVAEQIFSACGKTIQLEEKHFDLVTAISGSGPAYFFYIMELMVQKGQAAGLSEAQARALAVQTGLGASKLASEAAASPAELREQVTSKGGTTEAALKVLEAKGFSDLFLEALGAALQRGQELGQS